MLIAMVSLSPHNMMFCSLLFVALFPKYASIYDDVGDFGNSVLRQCHISTEFREKIGLCFDV